MRFRVRPRTPVAPAASQPEQTPGADPDAATGEDAAHEPPELELTSVAPPTTPVVVPRWVQLVLLPLAILGLWALARAAGSVLLILIVASIVALILAPLVRLFEHAVPRGLAIVAVYLTGS